MKPTTVNYFDLGPHEGLEIADFLRITDGIPDIDVRIYGIEANPMVDKQGVLWR